MYCSKCGKVIADDSNYCRYCGNKIEDSVQSIDKDKEIAITSAEDATDSSHQTTPQEIITTGNSINSSIANEVIANLKMIGIAAILWLVYIVAFSISKQNDIKPMDEYSWLGESCYDKSMSGSWITDWENQYALEVLMCPDYSKKKKNLTAVEELIFSNDFIPLSGANLGLVMGMDKEGALNYADNIIRQKKIPQEKLNALKKNAVDKAQADKEDFWNTISMQRQHGYEVDKQNQMKWAAIVLLSLFVIGRYLIRFCKWLAHNKS